MKLSDEDQAKALELLTEISNIVCYYLPPDGPSAHDAMTAIIGLVDPWPLSQPAPEYEHPKSFPRPMAHNLEK